MINILFNFIKKIAKNFLVVAFIIFILAIYYNYIGLYIAVLIYHIKLGFIWTFSFLGWTSYQVTLLLLVMFLPEIFSVLNKLYNKVKT